MGFSEEIRALVSGRQTSRRFADAEISEAAEILVVNGIAAVDMLRISRPTARTMGLEDLRADGYRQVDIQRAIEMVHISPPPNTGKPPKKVYDEVNHPARIRRAAELSGA